jgi:hypothetical protein
MTCKRDLATTHCDENLRNRLLGKYLVNHLPGKNSRIAAQVSRVHVYHIAYKYITGGPCIYSFADQGLASQLNLFTLSLRFSCRRPFPRLPGVR